MLNIRDVFGVAIHNFLICSGMFFNNIIYANEFGSVYALALVKAENIKIDKNRFIYSKQCWCS